MSVEREVHRRLNQAREMRGHSINSLARLMEDSDVKGANYYSINKYCGGHTTPPLVFLEAAAEALSVRREWLILGLGGATEVEEVARSAKGGYQDKVVREVGAVFNEKIPRFRSLNINTVGALWDLWVYFWRAQRPDAVRDSETFTRVGTRVAEDVARMVVAPLDSWGGDTDEIPVPELNLYYRDIARTLLHLLPPARLRQIMKAQVPSQDLPGTPAPLRPPIPPESKQ